MRESLSSMQRNEVKQLIQRELRDAGLVTFEYWHARGKLAQAEHIAECAVADQQRAGPIAEAVSKAVNQAVASLDPDEFFSDSESQRRPEQSASASKASVPEQAPPPHDMAAPATAGHRPGLLRRLYGVLFR